MSHFVLLLLFIFLPFQFALNPTPGIDLAIIRLIIPLLFLVWLWKTKRADPYYFKNNPVFILLATFLSLAVLSLFFSNNLGWSLRKLLFLFSIFPLYLIIVTTLKERANQKKILFFLVTGASLLAFLGLIQFILQFIFGIDGVYQFWIRNVLPFFLGNTFSQAVITHPSFMVNSNGSTYLRASGTFPDPHMFSYFLGMTLPWAIACWQESKKYKKLLLLCVLAITLADLLSFTRGGYVGLIAGAIVILPLVSRVAAIKILVGSLVIFFFLFFYPSSPVVERLNSSFDTHEGSNIERISNWKQALIIITENPLGVGIGMYSQAVKPTATYREPIYAHNLYLDIAAELGIHTLIVFILIIGLTFLAYWKKAMRDPFYIAGVASITVFAVHSLVENPLYSVHILPILLLLLAIGSIRKSHV